MGYQVSHFYSRITSARGVEIHRRNHRYAETEVSGWDLGVRVTAARNDKDGDVFVIEATRGSNARDHRTQVCQLRMSSNGEIELINDRLFKRPVLLEKP